MADLDYDTLAGKFAAAVRGYKPAASDDDDDASGGKVPRERLNREIAARKAAEAKVAEFAPLFEQLQSAHKTALGAKDLELVEQAKRIAATHAEDLQLVDGGFTDPLGRKSLRDAWEMEPKATRGATPAEWWAGVTTALEAHTADPEKVQAPKVPRSLKDYLPTLKVEAEQPKGANGANARTAPPRVDAGVTKAQRGIAEVDASKTTPEEFVAMLSRG